MGLLSEGRPLTWNQTKKYVDHVRNAGIQQFLCLYHKLKDRKGDTLMWGDEVEYALLTLDEGNKRARLRLIGPKILKLLKKPEAEDPENHVSKWSPEYASYMIEGTPGATPYGGSFRDFSVAEANMKIRRQQLYEVLKGSETFPLCITGFPRLGCPGFSDPISQPCPSSSASRSLYLPDEAVWYGHPRFITLTRNIRERRGEKVVINVPVFKDINTPSPFKEQFSSADGEGGRNAKEDHIYLDAMGFGMGLCCLQVTFQACDIDEARRLYDQLAVICPVVMAMSAGVPVFKGYLGEWDTRFNIITGAVDDRTAEERGLKPLKENQFVLPSSRYDIIDSYLHSNEYNDVELIYDQNIFQQLKDGGVDDLLAQHIAHLFVRDTVSLFQEKIVQDNEKECDHFENIQSTNWQSMRFKPPPPNSPIGWRVEFRPLEVQLTDFENAAFIVFVVLLTRAILSFNLNFYIPISKMQDNMRRASNRDAVNQEMFYFRRQVVPEDEETSPTHSTSHEEEYTLMTADSIINGKDSFPGLVPLVRMYVNSIDIDVETRCTIMKYLCFMSKKASGELMTTAGWIRKFVISHPQYKHDSVVTDEITYDLICELKEISEGKACEDLIGSFM